MSRYIDADMLVAVLKNLYEAEWNQNACTTWADAFKHCEEFVNEQPTVDVVEVIRCKDCKYYKEYIGNTGSAMMCFCPCCIGGQGKKSEDDYCSYGERREE